MEKRVGSLVVVVIVETILLLMLTVAFYELSQDDPCKCYYPPEGITTYTEECSDKVLAEEYTAGYDDGYNEAMMTLYTGSVSFSNDIEIIEPETPPSVTVEESFWTHTSIVFGDTDPPSTLSWEDGQLHFEGNADEAAKELMAYLIRDITSVCKALKYDDCVYLEYAPE